MEPTGPEYFMGLALKTARETTHRTSPNPKVGCVIVSEGRVISQGATQPVGGPHAEVIALRNAGARAQGAEMYVTLEPCSHTGRTPPCTDAIIAAGIRKVYVGMTDPNPLVNGRGLTQLRDAGIEVEEGVASEACQAHHASFSTFIRTRLPHVILKAGITLDGCIATRSGHSRWITGPEARADVHRLRAEVDGVMVGTETARLDQPRLTVRDSEGDDPIRIVLDQALSLDPKLPTFGQNTLVFCGPDASSEARRELNLGGSEIVSVAVMNGHLHLPSILKELAKRQILSVLVEGGGRLHGSFLKSGLAHEMVVYVAPRLLGNGRPLVDLPSPDTVTEGFDLCNVTYVKLGDDIRIRGMIRYPSANNHDKGE